ncbi:MAG: response regulator transcription factor, partial [Pyrinomonadaceae bacterium]
EKSLRTWGSMTILIVEDNDSMRRMIKRLVGDLTEAFAECVDGAQALATYNRYRPDWVLMDIKMNEMDGLAATREIKAAFPNARIVIVTGYDDTKLRDAARSAGACAYVHKENLLELRQILS